MPAERMDWTGTPAEFVAFAAKAGLPSALPIGTLAALVSDFDFHLRRNADGLIRLTVDHLEGAAP
jgi:hypothetical protein